MTWWVAPANSIRGVRDTFLCNHTKVISKRLTLRLAPCCSTGGGDYNALALCERNVMWIEDDWREKDTMATGGRFIGHFRRLGLQGWQIGGDQGFGGALMDRLAEQGYHLKRVRNGDPAPNKKNSFNLAAEQWSTVGKLIENRQIIIRDVKPKRLERLVNQLTSRQKIYDSDGRGRLEPKDKMKARGLRSPDFSGCGWSVL
jgi:hypothetical protein